MRENGVENVLRNKGSCQLQDPTTLPPKKQILCPLTGRHTGSQMRSGHFGEEKILAPLSGIEPSFFHRPPLSFSPSNHLHYLVYFMRQLILSTVNRWQHSTLNKPTFLLRGTALLHGKRWHIWHFLIEIYIRKVLKDLGLVAWFLYVVYRLIRLYILY
jgi:hypothetical protein